MSPRQLSTLRYNSETLGGREVCIARAQISPQTPELGSRIRNYPEITPIPHTRGSYVGVTFASAIALRG